MTPEPAAVGSDIAALADRSSAEVYRELIRLCGGDRQRAEDLRQDAFERAARHLHRHPDAVVDVGWMLTVARTTFIDHARRRGRESRLLERVLSSTRPVEGFEPDWDAIEPAQAMRLLGRLTDEQRAALVLFHLHDQPIHDVATALGRSVRATESLLVRGRHRLRTLVQAATDTGEERRP